MHKVSLDTPTKRLQWKPDAGQFFAGSPTIKTGSLFIKGPLPLKWITRAAILPGKTLHVGLAIWFQVGLEKCQTVKLSQKRVDCFSVSRDAKFDALKRLAEAGLINVEQFPGRSPIITVIQVD